MSSTVPWSVHTRRITFAVIGVASVGAAVGVQFAPSGLIDIRSATTPQLVGILALLLLPLTTVAAIVVDRRLWLRRWRTRTRAPVQIDPMTVGEESAHISRPVPEPLDHTAPVLAEKPGTILHAPAPRTPAVAAPRPRIPRIEVVVESKPVRHQVLTIYAVARSTQPQSKSAA